MEQTTDIGQVSLRGLDEEVLAVMAQPPVTSQRGIDQQTIHAFTPHGIRSRTAQRTPSGWVWMTRYDGEPLGWSDPYSYDGESVPTVQSWHAREHGWYSVPTGPQTEAVRS